MIKKIWVSVGIVACTAILSFPQDAQAAQINKIYRGTINFDNTDVVQSVDLGAIVDTTKSIILISSSTSSNTADENVYFTTQFEDNRTIQVTRGAVNAYAQVSYQVIEFKDGVSVQTGISSMQPGVLTKTITLGTTVNTAKSFPILNSRNIETSNTISDQLNVVPTFTGGGSTLQLDRRYATGTKAINITWQVISFTYDATVYTGTISLAVPGANTVNQQATTNLALSNTGNNAILFLYAKPGNMGGYDDEFYVRGFITAGSPAVLTVQRNFAGTTANTDVTVQYYVIDFTDGTNGLGLIQSGTSPQIPTGVATKTVGSGGSCATSGTTDTTPISVCITAHGWNTGNVITINGVTTNTNANGTWVITKTDANNFTLNTSGGTGFGNSALNTGISNASWDTALGTAVRDDRTLTYATCDGDAAAYSHTSPNDQRYVDDLGVLNVFTTISGTNYLSVIRGQNSTAILAKCNYFTYEFPPLTLIAPNGAETWYVGNIANITWKHANQLASGGTYGGAGPAHKCKLEVSTDGGSTYLATPISSTVDCTADTYAWTIPASISSTDLDTNTLRIRITDTDLAARNTDVSNANFTIKGTLTITSPNTAVSWNVGASNAITWTNTGNLDEEGYAVIKLYSSSGGVLDSTILASGTVRPSVGTYTWTVGDKIGSAWRIGVEASWDAAGVNTKSAVDFAIKGTLTLTAPNTAVSWPAQTAQNITWTKTGTFSTVKLDYSTNSGGSYANSIATGLTASTGTYSWTVPVVAISSFVRVKVSNETDTTVNAASAVDFTVVPSLLVTSPDTGAELWRVGTSHPITWTLNGSISTVDIDYSTNNGGAYSSITTGVTGSSGTYSWTIPDAIGDNNLVKVKDSSAPTTRFDVSNNTFKIRGNISITSPAGGEVWAVGSSQIIQWSKDGTIGNVDILYSTNGGSSYSNSLTTNATGTTWTWNPIPDNINSTLRVQVQATNPTYAVDTFGDSGSNFAIKGSLTVTSPNGGELWGASTSHNITWNTTGTIGNIKLEYSTNSGSTYPNTITGSTLPDNDTSTTGHYTWTLPSTTGTATRVKATLLSDSTVNDTSNADFSIRGSLTIVNPNGGQSWVVGSNQNIDWTLSGTIANVKLEYSTNSGSSYLAGGLIISSTTASALTYTWTIPDAIGSNVRVRISDASDATVNYQSAADFTIKGSLTITSPVGGESWIVGNSNNITWTKTGTIPNVKLDYSTNGGSTYTNAITASTPGGNLSYPWTIPDAIGTSVRVQITDLNAVPGSPSSSPANFIIKGSLSLTAPNGGEQWVVGGSQNITWNHTGTLSGNLKLEYSTDGGSTYPGGNLISNTVAATGSSYSWTIPDSITAQGRVKITYLNDGTVNTVSAANFTIKGSFSVTSPVGGESWIVGSVHAITWSKTGSITNAKLDYSTDGGATYPNSITASTPASNLSYNWTIPDAIGTQLQVRVQDASNSTVNNSSAANFTIKGSLTLSSPVGGETWIVGASNNITWSKTGTIANAKLEYSTDGGSTYPNTITASTSASSLSYAWTVPDAIGTTLKVKITNLADSTVTSSSGASFTVKGSVSITSPNGGESWIVGSAHNITWTKTGTYSNVKLEYSTNGFSDESQTFQIIASTSASAGTYAWTVADAISTTDKVRVSNATDSTVKSVSAANFTIKGSLTLTSPVGGEVWGVQSSHNVTWTKQGSIVNIKLTYSTDGGSTFPNTIAASTDATIGSYGWTIPDAIGSSVKVKIENTADSSVNFVSPSNFSIVGVLSVTSPVGGEKWFVNTANNITWTRTGSIANVKIDYSTDGGSTYPSAVVASTGAAAGTYAWTLPNVPTATARVRVADASNATVLATSPANFKIRASIAVTAPNGGEVWIVNAPQNITWTTVGTVSNVQLQYSTDGGQTYPNTITASTSNTGSYSWTVPDAISTSCKVLITNTADSDSFASSTSNFKIRGALALTSPVGGEGWQITSSHNITWTRTGSIANAKLEYSTNAFADETQTTVIIASTAASAGTYAWTIPSSASTTVKVRVSDASDSTVFAVSASNFSIKGNFVLTSPTGGEVWVVASTHNITWTMQGGIANAKLEYSTDAGVTYPGGNLIISSTSAAAGTYSWTVPNAIGVQLRIRVSDASDSTVNSASSGNFSIKGSIALTSPVGGETWIVGASQNITWTNSGSFANVKLEYSTNAFADETQTTVITASTSNNGSFAWTIPDAIGTSLKVRASDASNATVLSVSPTAFTIKGSLTITSPVGGETWLVGQSRNITWNKTGTFSNVKLEYSTSGGSSYPNSIIASTSASAGTYAWTVPDAIGTQLRVKVTNTGDATVNSASAGNFTVKGQLTLTAPVGGESWTVGGAQNITWTKQGTFSTVKLEYSTNAFADESQTTVIHTGTDAVTGTPYSWTVPDAIKSTVRVRVTNETDTSVLSVSGANFTIHGALSLTAPNGGESWTVASAQNITWTRTGSIANVKLQYSTNGGSTYPNIIIASTAAAAGAYSWTIPDAIGTNRRVQVLDASDPTVLAASAANFTIKGGFTISAPNGGEVWTVGAAQTISWTTAGTVANVALDYSTDGGGTYPNSIVASTANTGSYGWTVPDSITTLGRVRVSDVNNANALGVSASNFKMRGALAVTAPVGGEKWVIASSHNITWNRTGSIANVKLEYSTNGFSDESQTTVIIASTAASAGTYAWTIPDAPSVTVKVRVSDASDATVSAVSAANFSVEGSFTITSPVGGESWIVGSTHNVTWTKLGSIANAKLEYSTDAGSTWPVGNLITASTPASNLSYSWTIPDAIGSQLRVRVSDANDSYVNSVSGANFNIKGSIALIAPNGGEVWIVGASQNITWSHAGTFNNVKLEYSTNGFSDELQTTVIIASTSNNGTFSWSIPDAIGTNLKVRATNTADSTVVSISASPFTIKGSLTMTSPVGGEVWHVGENRSITWTKTGTFSNVKLEYSTNAGGSYPNLIIASTSAGAGTYTWTVPDAIGAQLRVKVTNTADTTVNNASGSNFAIKGQITVTAPNGGEVWTVNTIHNVTWTKQGTFATVKLEYSTNAFSDETQTTVIATGIDSVTGTPYAWTIPDAIKSTVRVRITNETDTAVQNVSAANFKIVGALTLTSPVGGESWSVNSSKNITWTRVGSIANVKLEYSTNSGSTYPNIITISTGAAAGAYSWTIPDDIGATRRVRVSDASDSTILSTSSADFTIKAGFTVTSPAGGEVWTVSSAKTLTWTTAGTVANVKIEYSIDGGGTYPNTIAATTANTGTYGWTVPDSITILARVRISDVNNANALGVSASNFKIRGAFSVTSPVGGEGWQAGSVHNIIWTTTGSISNAKLEYSTNGFSDESQTTVIIASTAASAGTYAWTIPSSASTTAKVRVSDASDSTVFAVSASNFSIKGSFSLTSPTGGEVWVVGSTHNITWTMLGNIANAKLEYSIDGGSTYPGGNLIVASTAAAAGTYSWTLPDAIGSQVRVRISDVNDSTVNSFSGANFSIKGSIALTAPVGGEIWIVGSNQNITWTHVGSFSNVKLEYSTNGFSDETQTTVITASTANNGTFAWSIPDAIGTSVKVRASDASNSTVVSVSAANFTIKGSLTITSPVGGELWHVGEARNITWNKSGTISNVKLEYSRDGGSTYPNLISSSTSASAGTYAWTVGDAIGSQVRIKVTNTADVTVNSASASNFTIKGVLTLTSPVGGEVWVVSSSHNITWTKQGTFATVKLEYSTNGFSDETQTTVIATGIDSVTGTPYAWTIPDAIKSTVRVRITNETDTSVLSISTANFKIVGSLTLTAPNGGENWKVSASKTITWTRVGSIANVTIAYSTNSGSTYPNVIVASTGAGAGAYSWTIPDDIGLTRRVKVSDASDATIFSVSAANFTIMGGFTLTAPNGGEVWTVGSAQTLNWTTAGTVANVSLDYSTDGGSTYPNSITATTPNTGNYSWTVPDAITTLAKIRVSDVNNSNALGASASSFKIRGALLVTAPNGGEQWQIGTSQNITWTRTGSIANVKIEYSTNGFSDESQTAVVIASTGAAAATYAWTIPDAPGTTNKVRITDASDSTVLAKSLGNFSIKGRLQMNVPNGGEVWTVAGVQNIQWTRFGSISNVQLQYSTDSGSTWPAGNIIIASTAASGQGSNNGSYSWTLPDAIGTHLRVRVQDAGNSATYNDSAADFSIQGSITLTAPNGGEIWVVGTNHNITWNHAGSFSNVKLEYSTNGFSDETQTFSITTATPNNGSFSWTIPDAIGTTLKVRASDASNSAVVSVSAVNFTIKGSLSITSPTGGEVWKVGENRNITWNRAGSIANVKLEYSKDGGSTYPNSIISSTGAAAGTYTWVVPDAIGSQLRVRVSNVLDSSVNSASPANFQIKGTVTVTAPNGGEVWVVNSVHGITWTKTGTYSTVKLEYSTDAFSDELQTTTIATGVDAVTGTPYNWTVPDVIGSSLRVRITNETDITVSATSSLNFKVVGSLAVSAPNGGESWAVGTAHTISWVRVGSIANAKIEYSTNGGSTYPTVIAASTGAAAQAYIWTIPDAIGSTRRVRISDASDSTVFSTSAANFTIMGGFAMTAPNGGEVWTVGSAQAVTWNTTGTVSNVKLEYSTNAFQDESQTGAIISSTPNTGNYSWTVADAISSLVKVRVSDVNNANANGISTAIFKIRGALLVNAPNGGEKWLIGTSQNITWTRTGSIANVKLEYSTNGFSDESQTAVVIASTGAAAGTYAWTIPNNPGTTNKVRVTDASDSTVLAKSVGNFSIKGHFTMVVPNGGEIWTVAGVQNIQWTVFGAISNVQLQYSTDSGSTWPAGNIIIASTAANAAYSWTIPDAIGTHLRVRTQDAADSSTYADSAADFKIHGAITVTAPNGGEVWVVGTNHNITWNHAGSFSNVKLEYSTDAFVDETQTFLITSATPNNGTFSWGIPDAIGSTLKVRASDAADSSVIAISGSNFTIKGSLSLTSPVGGEVWKVGENRNITWNRAGSIANVKLEYSKDGGITYPNSIISSTGAAAGTYTWVVPDAIGSQLRVRVSNVLDSSVNSASPANFQIKGTIAVVSPNGGEAWVVNSVHGITWTKTGTYSTVKLEYSTDAFADELQTTVIATGVDALTGTPYNWTIPDAIGSSVKVRITNESDVTVTTKCATSFNIIGALTLTAPNGGENWNVGTSHTVSWIRVGSIANVELQYSTDGGSTYPNLVVASTGAAAGAYAWTVPDSIGTNRSVKVTDASNSTVFSTSVANFAIVATFAVTQPNGGEVWTVASTQNIKWNTTGSVANVKLEYSTDGGSTYPNSIINSTSNNATYSWVIPDSISTLVKVRVSDVNNANGFAASNAVFKIRGALTLNAPNGGEQWGIGTTQNVQWVRTGSIANIKLEYSTNAFADENQTTTVINSTPAVTGTYAWVIPDAPGTNNKMRISDVSDSTVLKISSGAFNIKGSLIMTAPNGGENWIIGTPYNITWTKGGSISNVKLQYSTDSGSTWPDPSKVITTSTSAGFLSFTWTIPDDITGHGRVRIIDTNDNSVNAASAADFSIKGSLHMTSPVGTEIWTVGDTQNITWTKTGSISNVALDYSTDSGTTFPNSITASMSAAAGTYAWLIPDAISTHVRVRVTQTNDSSVTAASAADFKIRGALSINSPNGGEVWRVATTQPITWTKTGSISTIKIEYSTDGGTTYPNLIASGVTASLGSYSWTIPDAITTTARVKITNEADTSVNIASSANFKIAGSITVLTPNGGEKWQIASSQNISWSITGSISNIRLEYSTNGGSTYPNMIASSVNAASGTPYAWVIPDTPTIQARVKATNAADTTVFSTSNTNFKIQGTVAVTAPNGGENWGVSESHSITWTKSGSFPNVKIDYSTDSGVTYPNIISASTPSDNLSYSWTVPDNISTTARVRVTDVDDTDVASNSNGNFTIRGSLTMVSPNGGEVWRVGQAQNIIWAVVGSVANAKLEYSTNGFADETQTYQIAATVPAGNLSYAWNIPDALSNSVKVRISDVAGISLGHNSNGNFSIKGSISVTAPNGGESWGVSEIHNIAWTRTGSFPNMKLEYSTNAFADESQSNLIISSTSASALSYSWTIPDAISTTVKVRATDANDAATFKTSNNSFAIHGILTITSPNGGEKWIVGTSQLITWNRFGSIPNVKLQYTTNGSIYTDITVSTPNTGVYSWTIPNSITTTAKVRIYDVNNSTVRGDSAANFKIQAGFTVLSPNGGENWVVGSTQNITWATSGTVNFVKLDYSTDGGSTFPNSINTSTSNTGTYSWVIPDSVSGTAQVRVSDPNDSEAFRTSNGNFRIRVSVILTAPSGGEQWRVAQTKNITWAMVGTISNAKIQYSRDGFLADIQNIAASAPNTGTYAWAIPDSISNTVRVKVADPNDAGAFNTSNSNFRITGDFSVTAPNGGEKWDVNSTQNITWIHTGTVANAKLEYSTDGAGTWTTIVGLSPNNGSYQWTVPDQITAAGRIRISDPNDSTANYISAANFKIKAAYTVTSPNGGEIWTVADVHAVTWTNTGTVANSKLSYSTDSGVTFPNVVIASTVNSGTYNWTIPDAISTHVRVQVGSATDADAYNNSNADFKVRGKFLVTAPNGSEAWKIAQVSNITWVTTGTIANVGIYYSTDSGTTYPNVISVSTPNGANGATSSYSWTVPDVPTTNARIRVLNVADSTVYDDSDANFKIQGNFTITSPNGGEAWVVASTQNIKWNWGGTIPNVKLTYSTDSGSTYSNMISASTPNGAGSSGSASYAWTVPDTIFPTVRVKIEDPNDSSVNAESAADFKIVGALTVTSPSGGERWVANETHNVTWTTTGTVPNVKLSYSSDNFSTSTIIAASVANTGTYAWIIPDPGIANVPKATKVRVEDVRDSTVKTTSASISIDYYYVSYDIRDLLTNAALSELNVEEYKSTDKNAVIWQEGGITTNPPRVQPTPAGVWTAVFTKTGYGDLTVKVTADHDQSFSLFMETTVIHLWLAATTVSYNPVSKMLNVQGNLTRDGSLTLGALSATYKIYNGATLIGTYNLDKITDPALISGTNPDGFTGFFSKVIDGGPSGLNLQPGVVYTTLCIMPIGSGGSFKTPSTFEITAPAILQAAKDKIDATLDKPLSAVQAAIAADMNTQLTAAKTDINNKLDATSNTLVTKLDTTSAELKDQAEKTKVYISDKIDDFTKKSDKAVYRMQDNITAGSIRLILPNSTKVGSSETVQISTDPKASVTLEFVCPNGNLIENLVPTAKGNGIFSVSEKFSAQVFRCAVAKSVTAIATATIPSKDPAEPPFTTQTVASMFLVTATNDDIIASTSGVANAQKAAEAAKDAVEEIAKSLKGNGNIQDSLTKLQQTVDRFPAMMSESKGNAAGLKSAIEEVSSKLYAFLGNEGIDFRSVLKQEIGDGMKGMRNKVDRTLAATNLIHKIVEQKMGGSDQPIVQSFYETVET